MRKLPGLGIGAALTVLALTLSLLKWPFLLDEQAGLGALYALRGPRAAPSFVTVVAISEDVAARLGQPGELSKWRRGMHGELVDRLVAGSAAVIVFDLFFGEARDAAEDERFAASMARAGNVVLVEQLDEPRPDDADRDREWRNRPIGVLAATAIASADFPLPVIDDREVLRFWTFGRSHDGRPSLPLVAAQAYLATAYDDLRAGFTASHPGFAGRLPENHAALLASHDLTGLMRDIREEFVRDTNLRNELSLHAETLPERRREQLLALVDLYGAGHHRYFNLHGPSGTLRTVDYDAVLRGEVLRRMERG
jgi:hypothetical protein